MTIRFASRGHRFQKGLSIIELLVSASLGILVITSVGAIFISTQQSIVERNQRLVVIQSINDAFSYLKRDVSRAGFQWLQGDSLRLSGAVYTISSASDSLSYAYGRDPNEYIQVTFKAEDQRLKICQQVHNTPNYTPCVPVLSLTDYDTINVDDFNVDFIPLGGSVSSAYISITMTASLLDGRYSQTMETKIKQRNW